MKTKSFSPIAIVALLAVGLAWAGCDRKTRSNPADERHRAATPSEGGATLTEGSAGERQNFGDTRAKTQADGKSPSASPTGLSRDAKAGQQVEPQPSTTGPATGPTPDQKK